MSRSRSVSATTSEPKPGALVPAGLGRSIAAISGCALRAVAAASGLDFAMGVNSFAWGMVVVRSNRIAGRDATGTVGGAGDGLRVDIAGVSPLGSFWQRAQHLGPAVGPVARIEARRAEIRGSLAPHFAPLPPSRRRFGGTGHAGYTSPPRPPARGHPAPGRAP